MTRRICGVWVFFVLLVMAAACSVDARWPEPLAELPAPTAGAEAADKAAVRAAYVASVQRDAGPDYRIAQTASGVRAENKAQGLVAAFAGTGVQLGHAAAEGGEVLGIAATQWGCAGAMLPVGAAEPEVQGNRVDYRRGGFDEWYVNGPLGLEQGFTLAAPPACQREGGRGVVIALGGGGALRAEVSAQGDVAVLRDRAGKEVLRYGDLYVVDATGRKLPAVLEGGAEGLSIRVDDRGAAYPIEVDPLWTQQQKLIASDEPALGGFGGAVAISGDTAIVGGTHHAGDKGAAYVFVRSGITWTEQQKLTSSDGAVGDAFGGSVAVSGDTAIVGAWNKAMGTGAAYVFVRSAATWIQQQKLSVGDVKVGEQFGFSVAVSGDTVFVSTHYHAFPQGAVYVFVRSDTKWTQQQELIASDGAAGDALSLVAVSGDTAVVGAYGKAAQKGAAYVFVRSGATWTQQQKLTASDGAVGDRFGISIAVSGDTAVVGAYDVNRNKGAAYAFFRSGATWTEQQKLSASDGMAGDRFSGAVAVSGDTAVVGAPHKAAQRGAAYVFVRSGATWTEQQKLSAPAKDSVVNHNFGASVAVSGDTAVVGAVYINPAAYVFVLNGNPCSSAATCSSGHCVDGVCCDTACGGGIPNDCQACSKAQGTSADGVCSLLTGTACDDGDTTTVSDVCSNGTCVPNCLGVACAASDPCHQDGQCNPLNGVCSYPLKDNGTACDDHNPCTQMDTCQMGTCQGIENPCQAPDLCHPTQPCAPPPPEAGPPPVVSGNLKACETDDDCRGQAGHGTCSEEKVCCDERCGEKCKSCRVEGAEGTCALETNTDLKQSCGPKDSCGMTCAGGDCVAANGKTQCAPHKCTDKTQVTDKAFCPAAEAECPLAQRAVFDCAPYVCDPTEDACLRTCTSVSDCAPSFVCDLSHQCVPAPGTTVGNDRACAFGPATLSDAGARSALAALVFAVLLGARRRRASLSGPEAPAPTRAARTSPKERSAR